MIDLQDEFLSEEDLDLKSMSEEEAGKDQSAADNGDTETEAKDK